MNAAPRGRLRGVTGHEAIDLGAGWELAATPPSALPGPAELAGAGLSWMPAVVPGTAAAALRAAGAWSLDAPPRRFDAEDWWYRTRFAGAAQAPGEQVWLCCDGLATVAEVWLNGTPLLAGESMFTAHECRVDALLLPENELVIAFRALDAVLARRRPRPRWRAPMVEHQQLRWIRTTLLGRTPGWSPPAAAVGPWRPVRLERRRGVAVQEVRLHTDGAGTLDLSCRVTSLDGAPLAGATVVLARGGRAQRATLEPRGDTLAARLVVRDVEPWWPHTHGEPALYEARLELRHGAGVTTADLGTVGFRSLQLETAGGAFALRVNGVPVFCRGAAWTPPDPVTLAAPPALVEQGLAQVTAAGMNMLRVSGTMVYEQDAFLDGCDARGVLLWQDFMFASLDYPADDPGFVAAVEVEARQALARWQGRPSLAVLCGNGEAEQQAAMWGAPRERWSQALFAERLKALASEACPGVPYWPSSAHGGAFPHQPSAGTCSYYGVGAYLRPLEDARRAEVRFATECLGFANVPESCGTARVHDPAWKARSPRDLGAGWDFDDVRDHYVRLLFRVDPLQLRYEDHDRYLALGRVATGEVMAAVFAEWRRRRSLTRGGLVWFLRDLWPGAGFGVVDAAGTPKAAWHYLRRALAPVAAALTDEGGNGLAVHVANDLPRPLRGELELALWRGGETLVARAARPVAVGAHDAAELAAAEWFDGFLDLSHAYRFGPPVCDLVAATLRGAGGDVVARAFHFVTGLPSARERDLGLVAEARETERGHELVVRTRRFAQSVKVAAEGFEPDDDWFHLAPGEERRLGLRPMAAGGRCALPRGTVKALNAEAATPIVPIGDPVLAR